MIYIENLRAATEEIKRQFKKKTSDTGIVE